MNPSEYEIQREVEALRDIRRRSAAPGALIIDPDLPSQSSQNPYWVSPSPSTENDSCSSSSHDDASSSSSHTDSTYHREDDPLHLFWVPASVHPEIAPAEFRAFLKEHSRSPPPADASSSLGRSSSLSSTSSLGRKRSMLSRQYRPSENDGVEKEEKIVPLRRNRSSIYHNQGPQLTISDLQRLEQLAEEASESDDPTKLRTMLRRSLSLNISPTALEKMDRVPDMADEADAPIIIPPPNSIVRRAARTTKIRKPSLPGGEGDALALRGSSRRRGSGRAATIPSPPLPASNQSDHIDSYPHKRVHALSEPVKEQRISQDSFDEALIYDAYARDEEEDQQASTSVPSLQSTSPPPKLEPPISSLPISLPEHETVPSLLDALGPAINVPEVQPIPDQQVPHRSPSPPPITTSPPPQQSQSPPEVAPPQHPSSQQQPSFLNTPPTPQQVPPPKQKKSQKGLFKWGSDKGTKKHAKEAAQQQQQANQSDTKENKEKEPGFFGSLFSKKSNKDSSSSSSHGHDAASHGKESTATLGANKSSKNQQPPSPAATPGFGAPAPGGGVINNYSRYPLHVERAIYRLSHIKLANPRRPLYEQVLISNLMFWYLGVINRAQGQQQQQQQQQGAGPQQPGQTPTSADGPVGQENEREAMEAQRRSPDKERAEMQQQQQQQQQHPDMRHNGTYNNTNTNTGNKRESSPKRGPLTKPAPPGQGGRRGEMVVKGPQYDMQHRQMEQEYGGYGQQQQMGRGGPSWGYPQQQQQQQQYSSSPNNQPPRLVQPAPQQQTDENPFFYSVDMVQQPQPQQRLPPGAMAPLDQSDWSSTGELRSSSPPQRQSSTSPMSTPKSERRSRSPPPQLSYTPSQQGLMFPSQESFVDGGGTPNGAYGSQQQRPARSLSATAIPSGPPTTNGKIRKGVSASASVPSHKGRPRTSEGRTEKAGLAESVGEEEDVPLAVYQQQQRRR
ncbi:hypothetical protein L218DRAFT_996411 [Marasmius fiardii PR-910]|nr:hypothetical protein L218DRAFT_996411 [Marasmius fiardii PR-910]